MLIIFLDIETTGLNPFKHRAIEIAYKIFDSKTKKIVLRFESLIYQPAEIWANADEESLKVNGFTYEEVLRGQSENSIAASIIQDFNGLNLAEKGGVFLCQNPSFDRAFFSQLISPDLQKEYHWPYRWLDFASMYFAYQLIKDHKKMEDMDDKQLSKDIIAATFNIASEKKPHRALQGVDHLIQCFEAVFEVNLLHQFFHEV